MTKKKTASWGSIFLWFLFFFPVSFYLLITKLTTEKDKYVSNGKVLKFLSYLMVFLAVYLAFMWMEGKWTHDDGTPAALSDLFLMDSVMVFLAVFLFKKGTQYISRGQMFDRYLALLPQEQSIDIHQLSSEVKLPYQRTCSDLQYMIDSGYIPDAYIDKTLCRLVYQEAAEPVQSDSDAITVICPHCAGRNTVRDATSVKCCYCDSTFEI